MYLFRMLPKIEKKIENELTNSLTKKKAKIGTALF